jgi:acetyl esterase/lipase
MLASATSTDIDAAFKTFWDARNPQDAAKVVPTVLQSGVTFDEAFQRLKTGRTYVATAPKGVVKGSRSAHAKEFFYSLNVPESYDPTRRYQVRFQLHGGVMRPSNQPRGDGTIGALAGAEQIYIIPYAWADAPWWAEAQLENVDAILDTVKRSYNIDENRVVLCGVSDGGTGAFYFAMRHTTPFASYLPLNGNLLVLRSDDIRSGDLFPNNLRNKPFFVVNGGRDPLYPASYVGPYVEHLKEKGVDVVYQPQPNGVHNTAWWPDVKDTFEAFVREHPRSALPDVLTWETGDTAVHNRAQWLIIDTLGEIAEARGRQPSAAAIARLPASPARGMKGSPSEADQSLDDLNDMPQPPSADFGVQSIGMRINRVVPGSNADRIGLKAGDVLVRLNGQTMPAALDVADALDDTPPGSKIDLRVARENLPVELTGIYQPQIVASPPRHLFARAAPSGRVDLVRAGNTVTATTRGVAAFTLLLSPDQFDFGKPVKVVANGRTVFEGKVEKSLRTLLKFAAADNDRTMLFGAAIHVDLLR